MTCRLHKLWGGSDAYELVGSRGVAHGLLIPIRRWDLRADGWTTEWVLGGHWAPIVNGVNFYPRELRDMRSASDALLAGCARAGISIATVEAASNADIDTILVVADAKGRDRLGRYDPDAAFAANH